MCECTLDIVSGFCLSFSQNNIRIQIKSQQASERARASVCVHTYCIKGEKERCQRNTQYIFYRRNYRVSVGLFQCDNFLH